MAQQPTVGRQQEQDRNGPEAEQADDRREQAAPAQQAEAPELSGSSAQGQEDEQSKSPGWTDRGGMEHQQRSALDYNEWTNEGHAEHNESLTTEQPDRGAENVAPAQEIDDEKANRLQEARELMAAVNERESQGQELGAEKTIGD